MSDAVTEDESRARLERVDHIVVLMLENRSFDHMLGYLALDDTYEFSHEIMGLSPDMSDDYLGKRYPVHRLGTTRMFGFETPVHDGSHVDLQLANNCGGYARDYIKSRTTDTDRENASDPSTCAAMGYHDGQQLFAFDHLARHYTVCDHWFASVRGATMPNRLYSIVGTSGGARSNQKVHGVDFPLYHFPAFTRHLDAAGVRWRWYRPSALIPPTLKLFDPSYINNFEPFSFMHDFFGDAREGRLQSVSWIDPGFYDKWGMDETDDHPPANVNQGQHLVARVCNEVFSPGWSL